MRGVGGHSTRGKIAPGEFSAEEAAKLQLKNFKTEERLRKLYDGVPAPCNTYENTRIEICTQVLHTDLTYRLCGGAGTLRQPCRAYKS